MNQWWSTVSRAYAHINLKSMMRWETSSFTLNTFIILTCCHFGFLESWPTSITIDQVSSRCYCGFKFTSCRRPPHLWCYRSWDECYREEVSQLKWGHPFTAVTDGYCLDQSFYHLFCIMPHYLSYSRNYWYVPQGKITIISEELSISSRISFNLFHLSCRNSGVASVMCHWLS